MAITLRSSIYHDLLRRSARDARILNSRPVPDLDPGILTATDFHPLSGQLFRIMILAPC
jgi:hypothetical protein